MARPSIREAAAYDKILMGARAGNLPIEQPTSFELVIKSEPAKGLPIAVAPRRRGDPMTTRRAILRMVGAGVLIPRSNPARGQQRAKIPRIGVLHFWSRGEFSTRAIAMFRRRLSELGYVEGKTIVIDERYADGNAQRLSELARELAASKVDVIVAPAVAASSAARQATSMIPIVMVHAGNPVGAGLIASLARPGGNITGTSNLPLGGKHVDLLRELVPRVAKIAILANPANPGTPSFMEAMTDAARKFNIGVVVAEVSRAEDLPNAFTVIRNARPDGLLVMVDPLIGSYVAEVIAFAATSRLPAIYDSGELARQGGLIAYATEYMGHYTLAADYVDKILKGGTPGDLPVQQPARFELVINMKTAKTLGLTIPQSLLLRADEVIQ
jgi:putative ABC transport system substrate-binding protein